MGRDLDGTDDDIDYGNIGIGGQSELTIIVWAAIDSFTTNQALASGGTAVDNFYGLTNFGGVEDEVFCDATDSSFGQFDLATVHSTGDLICYVYRYDGGGTGNSERLRLFTNGTERTLTYGGTVPATLDTVTADLHTGEVTGFGGFMDGDIYHITILERAISTDEIAAISRGVHPFCLQGNRLLDVDHWGNESPERDQSGDDNDGTLAGTTQSSHIAMELRSMYL